MISCTATHAWGGLRLGSVLLSRAQPEDSRRPPQPERWRR